MNENDHNTDKAAIPEFLMKSVPRPSTLGEGCLAALDWK